jgi:hypothetical protein
VNWFRVLGQWGPAAIVASGVSLALVASPTAEVIVVRPDGSGDFPTIQEALDAAGMGAVIELTSGVFRGPGNRAIEVPDRALTIRSQGGDPEQCIIDCEGLANGFGIWPTVEGTVIEGITVTRGYAGMGWGGALAACCGPSRLIVRDCVFRNNSAGIGGGAVADDANSTFIRCRFIENSAAEGGAFITSARFSPTLEDCEFIGNSATHVGGAVFLEYVEARDQRDRGAVFRNCLFLQNTAPGGSGVMVDAASPTFENCTLVDNSASDGAIHCAFVYGIPSNPLISHCIIAFSSAGRGVSCDSPSQPILECCDVFGNAGGDWVGCLEGQLGVRGNIWADPLFCDREGGDFRLQAASPCAPDHNPECGLIGALPVGCGSTPTWETTWGAMKALFRTQAK